MGLCCVGIKPAQELSYIFLVSTLEGKTVKLDFVSLSQLSLSRRPQGKSILHYGFVLINRDMERGICTLQS